MGVKRRDLNALTDPRAGELAIADNFVGELDLDWDTDMLQQLQDDGLDLSAFWTAEEFAELVGNSADHQGEENAVVAPGPTDIRLGDLFYLGRHRLLCGDATSRIDVARLLGDEIPPLLVSDPPYGVDYDPAWRHRMDPSQRTAVGRVPNDDRADWTSAWAVFRGSVIYCGTRQ